MSITENFYRCKYTRSDINEHMDTLLRYAKECKHITEMGVRSVVSTWAFLESKPTKLVCIDIEDCPVQVAESLAKESGIDFTFVRGDTRKIEIEETDLLFIDTWHIYEQLKKEFELHANKVRKYIIMHDTTTFGDSGEGGQHRGLWPAVEEFLGANSNWRMKERFTHNNGLTILERI
jgi:hypothetical protein